MKATALLLGLMAVAEIPAQTPAIPKNAGVVRGRVLLSNGRPARGATVRLTAVRPGLIRMSTTDLDGRYEFVEEPNDYRVSAGKTGYLTLEYGQQRAFEHGTTLTVRNGDTLEKIDITLPGGGTISGRVMDAHGDAVEGVSVRLMELRFSANRLRLLPVAGVSARVTDDQGEYRLYAVPPGRYFVVASPIESSSRRRSIILPAGYVATFYPGTASPSTAKAVTVALSQGLDDVSFTLARESTSRISGVVIDSSGRPIETTVLLARSQRSGAVASEPNETFSSGDGRFEFANVLAGEWVVQARKMTGNLNQGKDGEFATQFISVNGADVSDVRLQTSAGSTVEGRVTFEGPEVPDPTAVAITSLPADFDRAPMVGPSAIAYVRPDRSFSLSGLNGSRLFRLLGAAPPWTLKSIYVNGRNVTDQPLSFGSNADSLTNMEVTLTNKVAGIAGTVIDARGAAVSDYTIIAFAADSDQWYQGSRFLAFTRPRADRTFAIGSLPPGEYRVVAIDRMRGDEESGEWQDPEVLRALAPRATHVTLAEGMAESLALRLVVR